MRMTLLALFILAPTLALGQSLAEVAKKEKSRRDKNKQEGVEVQVLSESDLGSGSEEPRDRRHPLRRKPRAPPPPRPVRAEGIVGVRELRGDRRRGGREHSRVHSSRRSARGQARDVRADEAPVREAGDRRSTRRSRRTTRASRSSNRKSRLLRPRRSRASRSLPSRERNSREQPDDGPGVSDPRGRAEPAPGGERGASRAEGRAQDEPSSEGPRREHSSRATFDSEPYSRNNVRRSPDSWSTRSDALPGVDLLDPVVPNNVSHCQEPKLSLEAERREHATVDVRLELRPGDDETGEPRR